jgi:hypothetical protein
MRCKQDRSDEIYEADVKRREEERTRCVHGAFMSGMQYGAVSGVVGAAGVYGLHTYVPGFRK